ncbi:MAG: hypothetical protein ACR2JU_12405 [Nocardioidaceae bacterium]
MAYDETAQRALLDEASRKSAIVWLCIDGRSSARWHAWLGGHLYLLTGPGEQPEPGLAESGVARVVVRSKDDGRHLLTVDTDVSVLRPSDEDWAMATAELAKLRLNLSDPAHARERWADPAFTVYRLTPRFPLAELPGGLPDDSRRRTPVPTPATTTRPVSLTRRRVRRWRPRRSAAPARRPST